MRRIVMILGVLLAVGAAQPGVAQQDDDEYLQRARELLRQVPLIDGHNDLPTSLLETVGGDLDAVDLESVDPRLSADLPRLRKGGVGAQFFSIFAPAETALTGTALHEAMREVDVALAFIDRYDGFELALTADDIERIFAAGRIAALLGLEGGHMIEDSLANLRVFQRLGIRYMTLTHFMNTAWADSANDAPTNGGLSAFGEEVVRELNRLGMFVDLSHVSPDTMHDALRVSSAPVIFSHSGAAALSVHPRNVPDDVLARLPANGGVIMVDFVGGYTVTTPDEWRNLDGEQAVRFAENAKLTASDPVWSFRRREYMEAMQVQLNDAVAVAHAMQAWDRDNPEPRGTLADVADQIEHIVAVSSIANVGLGSDYYDAGDTMAEDLEDVTRFPYLLAELLRRGWSDEDVKKLAGLNLLRAMRAMERAAAGS